MKSDRASVGLDFIKLHVDFGYRVIRFVSVYSRPRHTRVSAATVQEAEENKDSLQPQPTAETRARVREKSLRGGR